MPAKKVRIAIDCDDAAIERTQQELESALALLRQQLRHAPVVEQLAAAHGVAEVHLPVVARVGIGQRRRDAALRRQVRMGRGRPDRLFEQMTEAEKSQFIEAKS